MPLRLLVLLSFGFVPAIVWADDAAGLKVTPEQVALHGRFAQAQLIVQSVDATGAVSDQSGDLTHEVVYASSDPRHRHS